MNKNVLLGVGAIALCGAALYTLSGPSTPVSAQPGVSAAAAAPSAAAAPRHADAARHPEPGPSALDAPAKRPPPPNIAVNPGDDDLEGTMVVVKEDFEDALVALDELPPNANPDDIGLAIRDATRALSRLEEEADANNPQHKRLHDEAVRQLQTRLAVIGGGPQGHSIAGP